MRFLIITTGCLLIALLWSINGSCQLPGKYPATLSKIDTSIWLKETRGIRDILEDAKGNLWFSSPDYVARLCKDEMYYFSEKDGLGSTGNLHEDANGALWVENGFRAFKYNGENFSEEKIDRIQGTNNLWIQRGLSHSDTAYTQPGLYEVTQKGTHFHPLPVTQHIHNKYLYFPSTKARSGKDGTIWIGTMEKVFGFKNSNFITIGRAEMGRQQDEHQMGIRGIFVDSRGKLWIADNGAGIFVFDGTKTKNFTWKQQPNEGSSDNNPLHRSFSIAEDTDGNMWFGTAYAGVWRYNPDTEQLRQFTSKDGIKSDIIWTIYQTKTGELLFAGESPAAVYQFNGNTFDRNY
jgi:ligand-binding sensor domain-containing protein